ncbi:hypothetical protein HDU76_004279 [Blyttiomyces sp. JEL0837]|nr:hypothetical protein HDU76_004279 [Blyttiomyces sp. JEL0837]
MPSHRDDNEERNNNNKRTPHLFGHLDVITPQSRVNRVFVEASVSDAPGQRQGGLEARSRSGRWSSKEKKRSVDVTVQPHPQPFATHQADPQMERVDPSCAALLAELSREQLAALVDFYKAHLSLLENTQQVVDLVERAAPAIPIPVTAVVAAEDLETEESEAEFDNEDEDDSEEEEVEELYENYKDMQEPMVPEVHATTHNDDNGEECWLRRRLMDCDTEDESDDEDLDVDDEIRTDAEVNDIIYNTIFSDAVTLEAKRRYYGRSNKNFQENEIYYVKNLVAEREITNDEEEAEEEELNGADEKQARPPSLSSVQAVFNHFFGSGTRRNI